jgi:DNA polymerase I-like protein with 3'-5' exonuclease and polymerase domains
LRCRGCGRRGWVVETDWSQQEPRLLAINSGDPILIDNYERGLDVYKTVGSAIFGCEYNEIRPKERQATKVLFLSMAYGAGIHTQLVALHGADEEFRRIDHGRLEKMNKAFFKEHPWIKSYQHRCVDEARAGAITEPLSGHQLVTGGYVDPAVDYNFKMQAGGAWMMANSILAVDEGLDPRLSHIYANMHDAIVTGSLEEDPLTIVKLHVSNMEKRHTINGSSINFPTETKLSSDSLGHALELKNDLTFKASSLREMSLGLAMAAMPQEGCSQCTTR